MSFLIIEFSILRVNFDFFSGELQVQLRLPVAIMNCKARSELSSLALLGQGNDEY